MFTWSFPNQELFLVKKHLRLLDLWNHLPMYVRSAQRVVSLSTSNLPLNTGGNHGEGQGGEGLPQSFRWGTAVLESSIPMIKIDNVDLGHVAYQM